MKLYQIDAFAKEKYQGNPAGVALLEKEISEVEMQKIATELNLSETVFIKSSDKSEFDYQFRFFTPTDEVDMCGHATISGIHVLLENELLETENPVILTKAGLIDIKIVKEKETNKIFIKQPEGINESVYEDYVELSSIMGLKPSDIEIPEKSLKPTKYSTGLFDLLIPVKNEETLDKIKIDKSRLIEFSKKLDIVGFHVYTFLDPNEISCRNFAPLYGIDEEAATGTSNGALISLLKENKLVDSSRKIIITQGKIMNRESEISGYIDHSGIWVGGRCKTVFTMTLVD